MEMKNIVINDLAFAYGKRELFRDISFQLQPGSVHYLAGPNGAGKSTLMKIICGALKPASGTIQINGTPLEKFNSNLRARVIGTVWQNVVLNLDFTVRELVEILASARFPRWGRLSRADEEVIIKALEMFDLKNISAQIVNTLSGGEKARVMLAGIFALEPDIMLLDEPTAPLDPAWRNRVSAYMGNYARDHVVLHISHDFELIGRCQGSVMLLGQHGEFFCGEAGKILTDDLLGKIYATTARVETTASGKRRISFD